MKNLEIIQRSFTGIRRNITKWYNKLSRFLSNVDIEATYRKLSNKRPLQGMKHLSPINVMEHDSDIDSDTDIENQGDLPFFGELKCVFVEQGYKSMSNHFKGDVFFFIF